MKAITFKGSFLRRTSNKRGSSVALVQEDERTPLSLSWRLIWTAEELVPAETPETLMRGVPACWRAKQTRSGVAVKEDKPGPSMEEGAPRRQLEG